MEQNYFDFIICGGGASGLLLLKALREDNYFDNYSVLLIEKEVKNKNDRTWCFWESSSDTFDDLLTKKWSNAEFRSKGFKKQFDLAPLLSSQIIFCFGDIFIMVSQRILFSIQNFVQLRHYQDC